MKLHGDEDLRARFGELRNDDRAHAPEFDALWKRAELRARTTARPRMLRMAWVVAAAGIVLIVGILVQRSRVRDLPARRRRSATETMISNWTSPTASLLRTPGGDLLAPPAIFSSILDGATGAAPKPQGD
jgi:hypothetical protein